MESNRGETAAYARYVPREDRQPVNDFGAAAKQIVLQRKKNNKTSRPIFRKKKGRPK
jgi:hypothetical protein